MKLRLSFASVTFALGLAHSAMALNPQPEPPGVIHVPGHGSVHLNPQPEPPGVARAAHHGSVQLNPQPEPPGIAALPRPPAK